MVQVLLDFKCPWQRPSERMTLYADRDVSDLFTTSIRCRRTLRWNDVVWRLQSCCIDVGVYVRNLRDVHTMSESRHKNFHVKLIYIIYAISRSDIVSALIQRRFPAGMLVVSNVYTPTIQSAHFLCNDSWMPRVVNYSDTGIKIGENNGVNNIAILSYFINKPEIGTKRKWKLMYQRLM